MKWFENFRFWSVRVLLLLTFLSYYLLMVLTHFDIVEAYANPLQPFKGSVYFVGTNLYAGPYPDPAALERLQRRNGIRRVVSVLNPETPFVRELVLSEAEACRRLGMEYIVLPDAETPELAGALAPSKIKTYVHGYFMTSGFSRMVRDVAARSVQ
ncbi:MULTISPECIES: hypothetical protein [Sulfurimonas]|uniref:Uncharacterized protein n=1 Tax=Sulfurimonas diazotrophicus TaxID=3131939 RepID=A0ABZ3H6X2_9BACT